MRQLTKRLTCSGFFSGLIITASSGLCQEPSRYAEIQKGMPVTKHVAWDQIPALNAKPISHATALPVATAALIGPSDVSSPASKWPGVKASGQTVQLPWDVVVAPNVPGHSSNDQPVAASGSPTGYQAQETSGLIGPADFQPTPTEVLQSGTPLPQAPVAATPPKSSKVSLLPMTAAIKPNAQSTEPPVQASPSDRAVEQQTYVLQDVRAPEKAVATHPETLIPIDILPFNRLVSSDTTQATDLKYSTAQMTGPLTDASMLFSQLHIDEDYRNVPAVALSPVRTVADASGFGPEWMYNSYAWVSPTFYHKPLYFEQVNLERYGIGPRRGLQPFYSAAHFYLSLGLMPYKMLTQHPCEHVFTLGNNRPGDCVPYQKRSLLGQSYPFEAFKYFHSSCYR